MHRRTLILPDIARPPLPRRPMRIEHPAEAETQISTGVGDLPQREAPDAVPRAIVDPVGSTGGEAA